MAQAKTEAEKLDDAFNALVKAAIDGKRCPMVAQLKQIAKMPTKSPLLLLAQRGKIWVGVYGHNFTVVEILEGPHKGARTAEPTIGTRRPYKEFSVATI